MSREEKHAKVLREHTEILQFGSHWNDVLTVLGLSPAVSLHAKPDPAPPCVRGGGGSGGESAAHKALKAYVKAHPSEFGANASWEAFEEYPLRSADTIDVFFKSDQAWVGVEVKSAVSDGVENDYQRGLFQVVKYKALLEAQARADQLPIMPRVKVLLVLENVLPTVLRPVARTLGIEVREHVKAHLT
ncbi:MULTISPECIES: hypothetical protein [unclassified Pigmentiphaga]|uniref:hypothetical protein n=1 Tax=unclassified Pigmentiphaga TaxID=2626614 RepID=UPI00112501D7|nr:hypothetical protein [Pigmentiphaga sp. NML030171]